MLHAGPKRVPRCRLGRMAALGTVIRAVSFALEDSLGSVNTAFTRPLTGRATPPSPDCRLEKECCDLSGPHRRTRLAQLSCKDLQSAPGFGSKRDLALET